MNEKQRKDRIARAKSKRPSAFGYIERSPQNPSVIDSVRCKMTGNALQAMVEDDRFDQAKEIRGRQFIYRRVTLAPTPMYDELTIEMDDGSNHITPICKARKRLPFSQDDLEAIYMADLEEWSRDGMDKELLNQYAERTPVRVVK